eukprot:19483-Heterococcus_DN1.PRE.5
MIDQFYLRLIAEFTGRGHALFFTAVSTEWQKAYAQAHGTREAKRTTAKSAFASAGRLIYAHESGLQLRQRPRFHHCAGSTCSQAVL